MTREEKQKAIDALKISAPVMAVTQEEFNDYIHILNQVMDWLEQEPKWIPVSESLPEENTAVLIWCPERRNIYCAYLEEKQWWIFGAYFQKVALEVIAWMPLPTSYEPQEGSKE